jgi:hypothetical protein
MSSIQVTSTTWKKEKVRERIEKLQDQKTSCIFACPSKMKITSLHFHVCLLVALSNTKDNKWLEIDFDFLYIPNPEPKTSLLPAPRHRECSGQLIFKNKVVRVFINIFYLKIY